MSENIIKDRAKYVKDLKRVEVKIGSSSVTSKEGGLDLENMGVLTGEVKALMDRGIEVILVSSGAIAALYSPALIKALASLMLLAHDIDAKTQTNNITSTELIILFIMTTIMVRTAGTKKDPRYAGLNQYDNHSPAGDFVFDA